LTDERVELFLQRMAQIAELLHGVPAVFSLQRDPDDAKYVDLAAAAAASFLVTRDQDLRSLMNDATFLKSYPGLSILEPPAFLSHLRTVIAKDLGYE
jgi:predicted nucleic acid-binding protein